MEEQYDPYRQPHLVIPFFREYRPFQMPLTGNGLLSGSFPLSFVTQEGNLPTQAEIRILYRPERGAEGDGYVVATTICNADGTWQVSGLNENLKFDIVARIPGFNDVIISDVQPTGAPLTAYFAGIKEEYEYEEEVSIQVVALGGKPPYSYTVNTLPEGLTFDSGTGYITGSMPAGDLMISITVTDAMNDSVTITWEGTVVNPIPTYIDTLMAMEPIAFWDFEEPEGPIATDAVAGVELEERGTGVSFGVPGRLTGSHAVKGNLGGYLQGPSLETGNLESYSILFHVALAKSSNSDRWFQFGGIGMLLLAGGNHARIFINGVQHNFPTMFSRYSEGEWIQFAVIVDSGVLKVHINSDLVVENAVSNSSISITSTQILTFQSSVSSSSEATVDLFSIFDRALSDEEVYQLNQTALEYQE